MVIETSASAPSCVEARPPATRRRPPGAAFVADYSHARYDESLANLTPADVYFGRAETILLERERIKRQTIANRRLQHQLHAAKSQSQMIQSRPSASRQYVSNHLTTDPSQMTRGARREAGPSQRYRPSKVKMAEGAMDIRRRKFAIRLSHLSRTCGLRFRGRENSNGWLSNFTARPVNARH